MKFIIKSISSDKTEIRLTISPTQIGGAYHYIFGTVDGVFDTDSTLSKYIPPQEANYLSTGPHPAIIRLLVAYLKDFVGQNTASDYVLVTKDSPSSVSKHIPIINLAVDDINLQTLNSSTLPSLVIKLSEPLPSGITTPQETYIERKILTGEEQEFYYIPKTTPSPTLRGLDYDEGALNEVQMYETDTYESYNDLTSSLELSDDTIIHGVLSSSYSNLKVNYSNFSNHIHYGSAVKKIENFKTKIINIEKNVNLLSQSLQETSSLVINDYRKIIFGKLQTIKSSFTPFERALYYEGDKLGFQNPINLGSNYADTNSPINSKSRKILLNKDGFNKVFNVTGSDGNVIPIFHDKYNVEDKPFYNHSGSFYLSFLMRGDEAINGNINWINDNQNHLPTLPYDTLFTSSLLQPSVKSGSWQRYIYHASMSYFSPHQFKSKLGSPGSITNFSANSNQINVLSGSKTGSFDITLGSRYTNLGTVLTSSGVPFRGSIVPAGELFKVGINTGGNSNTTSSFITEIKITKENPINFKPFMEVYPTGSTEFTTWYNNQIISASNYDDANINSFFNNLPQYIINDFQVDNKDLKTFLSMLGELFDLIRTHITNYKSLLNTDYDIEKSIPDNLLPVIANQFNWEFKVPFGNKSESELKKFLGSSLTDINSRTTKDAMNNIWRNVLNNLNFIYKSKGTKNSINYLLNSYGLPSSILKIREHGASLENFDKSVLNDNFSNTPDGVFGATGNVSFTEKTDKLVSYNITNPGRTLNLPWHSNSATGEGIEFLLKGAEPNKFQEILFYSGGLSSSLWDVRYEPDGTDSRFAMYQKSGSTGGFDLEVAHSGRLPAYPNQIILEPPFTITLYLKPSMGPMGAGNHIFSELIGTNGQILVYANEAADLSFIQFKLNSRNAANSIQTINFDFPNDANYISQRSEQWNHIRITSGSGEHVRCFLNGVESTTGAVAGTNPYGIEDMRTSNSGSLDEVAVFNRVVPDSEVRYSNTNTPKNLYGLSDLRHWWRMGDSGYDSINDEPDSAVIQLVEDAASSSLGPNLFTFPTAAGSTGSFHAYGGNLVQQAADAASPSGKVIRTRFQNTGEATNTSGSFIFFNKAPVPHPTFGINVFTGSNGAEVVLRSGSLTKNLEYPKAYKLKFDAKVDLAGKPVTPVIHAAGKMFALPTMTNTDYKTTTFYFMVHSIGETTSGSVFMDFRGKGGISGSGAGIRIDKNTFQLREFSGRPGIMYNISSRDDFNMHDAYPDKNFFVATSHSIDTSTGSLNFRLATKSRGNEDGLFDDRVEIKTEQLPYLGSNQFWNILLQRKISPNANNNLTQSIELLVGQQDITSPDKIKYLVSASTAPISSSIILANFTSSLSASTQLDNQLYVGRTFSGSIAEFRVWNEAISASKFKQHILDKKSVVGNTATSSQDNIMYRFKFNERFISGSNTFKIKDSNPNNIKDYSFTLPNSATSSLGEEMFDEDELKRIQFNVRVGGTYELSDNNIIIDQERRFLRNLNPTEPSSLSVYNPLVNKRKASSVLELTRSPQDVINDFILNQLGNFDFNDKFADPRDINKLKYKDLEIFAKNFFDHYDVSLNVNKYIRAQTILFNKDLIDSLKRLVPARASFEKVGVELKPTFLERQKIKNYNIEREIIDIQGGINLTHHTSSKYAGLTVGTTSDNRTSTQEAESEPGVYNKNAHIEVNNSVVLTEEYIDSKKAEIKVNNSVELTEEYITTIDAHIGVSNISGGNVVISEKYEPPYDMNLNVGVRYDRTTPTYDGTSTYGLGQNSASIEFVEDKFFSGSDGQAPSSSYNNTTFKITSNDNTVVTYEASGSFEVGTIAPSGNILFPTGSHNNTGSIISNLGGNLLAAMTHSNSPHTITASAQIVFGTTGSVQGSSAFIGFTAIGSGLVPTTRRYFFPTGSQTTASILAGTSGNTTFVAFNTGSDALTFATNFAAAVTSSQGFGGSGNKIIVTKTSVSASKAIIKLSQITALQTNNDEPNDGNNVLIEYSNGFTSSLGSLPGKDFNKNPLRFEGGEFKFKQVSPRNRDGISKDENAVEITQLGSGAPTQNTDKIVVGGINSFAQLKGSLTASSATFLISKAAIENSKLHLTSSDGTIRTYEASSSIVNGTLASSGNILFMTGSTTTASVAARDAVRNLAAAITSSTGHGGRIKAVPGNWAAGGTLKLFQSSSGAQGNKKILFGGAFGAAVVQISGINDDGIAVSVTSGSIVGIGYNNNNLLEFKRGTNPDIKFKGGVDKSTKVRYNPVSDYNNTGSITFFSELSQPLNTHIEINSHTSSLLAFTKNEPLQSSKNISIEVASELPKIILPVSTLEPLKEGDFKYNYESDTFSDFYYKSYEDKDINKNWGTTTSDTFFIQYGSGSDGSNNDNNTYHYDNRQVFRMIGDVETISGSYASISSSFETDFTGVITAGKITASKDFSNQTVIKSNTGLGLRPLGTTVEFKVTGSIAHKGGKFLDEFFVYPANHTFIVGSSKDDLDVIYTGTKNNGERFFDTEYWNDLSKDAYYYITNTNQNEATITY